MRNSRFLFLIIVGIALTGCDRVHWLSRAGEAIGVTDAPPPVPVARDMLCDASTGSTCSEKTLSLALDAILPTVAARPGSVVRLWTLAETVAGTRVLAERVSTPSARPSTQAVRAHEKRFVEETKLLFLQAAQPLFDRPARRSPIAESIVKVSLASVPKGAEREIVLVTDGREESSFGHFECGRMPSEQGFLRQLHAASLLLPESLKGIRIIWCFFSLEPVPGERCPATLDRFLQTKSLWAAALHGAGADVQFESSAPERN
ncbi:MAG: hypothetical protein ACHREM_11985 [Polyangiales bacterium]